MESAVSSGINLEEVNCVSFSLQMKISWPSFLIMSAEKFFPNIGVCSVHSLNNSFGKSCKDLQRSQLETTSLMILVCPEQ